MTAGLDQFQVAAPDQYAGASPQWKRRLLAAQLLQQQAQTGDKVYGAGLGSMKLLASALGGWMEGKEEAKVLAAGKSIADTAPSNQPDEPSGTGTQSNSSKGAGTSTTPSPLDTQMRQTFMDTLKEKGLTNPYALAVADSFGQHESGWDPKKLTATWSDPSESGQAGTSGGALSWRDDRHRNMTDFVSKSGEKDPTRAQALFFLNENPDLIKRMQASKGLEDAHDNMSGAWKYAGYDRPGGGEYANRLATARARLAAYQGGQSPVAAADEPATPDPRAAGQVASIAGTMAPPGAPKAEPVPGQSMAPPDLKTGAAPLPPVRPPETYPGKPQLAPPGAAPVIPSQPAAEAPPAPQQMAQAQTQPQASGRPQAVTQTAQDPARAARDRAWANMVLQQHGAGIPGAAPYVAQANAILNPQVHKLNDTTMYTVGPGGQIKYINAPVEPSRPMTAEERKSFGVAADRAAHIDARGNPHYGPVGQNINLPGAEKEEDKGRGKGLSDRLNKVAEDGDAAIQDNVTIKRMSQLSTSIEPGRKTALLEEIRGRTGITLDPNADNVQAFKAMINYMKPRMRVAGSGTSSDRDMAAFEGSLPQMTATPGGNELIVQTLGGMAEFRQQRGEIAQLWQLGEISAKEANQRMAKLGDPFVAFKQWQDANKPATAPAGAPAPAAAAAPPAAPAEIGGYKIRRLN